MWNIQLRRLQAIIGRTRRKRRLSRLLELRKFRDRQYMLGERLYDWVQRGVLIERLGDPLELYPFQIEMGRPAVEALRRSSDKLANYRTFKKMLRGNLAAFTREFQLSPIDACDTLQRFCDEHAGIGEFVGGDLVFASYELDDYVVAIVYDRNTPSNPKNVFFYLNLSPEDITLFTRPIRLVPPFKFRHVVRPSTRFNQTVDPCNGNSKDYRRLGPSENLVAAEVGFSGRL